MSRIVLENGLIKLTSEKIIMDVRNNLTFSEVICKSENEKYYVEIEG